MRTEAYRSNTHDVPRASVTRLNDTEGESA
jgi:hypothetical protein